MNKTSEEIVEEATNNGIKVASIDIIRQAKEIILSEKEINKLELTLFLLKEYCDEVKELGDYSSQYLEKIKHNIFFSPSKKIDSQNQVNAVNRLMELINNKKRITISDIEEIHKILLDGEKIQFGIRESNSIYIGVPGERIDCVAIDYKQIETALNIILDIYNAYLYEDLSTDMLITPIIIHGLFASLQMFHNGNKRLGRLMQNVLMWQLINKNSNYKFDSPVIYSNPFDQFYAEYQKLTVDLVVNGDNLAWNKWIMFNLNRIEDQKYLHDMDIDKMIRNKGRK